MNSRNTIADELKALESNLSPHLSANPFIVPQGYFEGLAEAILQKVKASENNATDEIASLSPLLAGLSRKMPYAVPDQFFAESPMVPSEESELLAGIGKNMPYALPQNYFEELPGLMLQKVAPAPKAKVVSMRTGWMRMAAAAVVTGAVALGGWLYLNRDTTPEVVANGGGTVVKEAPSIPAIEQATTEELNAFIQSSGVTAMNEEKKPKQKPAADPSKTNGTAPLLEDVSVAEMKEFLEEMPFEVVMELDETDASGIN